MKYIITPLLLSIASSQAGTITLPTFGTEWDRENGPGQPQVITGTEYEVDLNDRTGLTPGAPIKITISSQDQLLWLGGFHIEGGQTSLSINFELTLMLGGQTSSSSTLVYEEFGDLTGINETGPGQSVSDIVGYSQGPVLPELSIIVPWDTDLSKGVFTFGQDAELTGEGNFFNQSSIYLTGGIAEGSSLLSFDAVSVPEPSSSALLAFAGLGFIKRRRR